jgi:hypothetical protein
MPEPLKRSKQPIGSTYIAQNGYHYTKVEGGKWRLTHHLVMENHLGRVLIDGERVHFKDHDKTNYQDPNNLEIVYAKGATLQAKLARLEAKRDEIIGQIAILKDELVRQRSESTDDLTRRDFL